MGRFVVFEGGEGSGKSTQARVLAERWGAVLTHEPGDTPVGARLRELLLDPSTEALDERAEALLMAADRAHHVATLIRPALLRGHDVVCDRYLASSVAYQGWGRELGPERIADISAFATDGLVPDLVVLMQVPAEVAAVRLAAAGAPDKLEAAGDAFHRRVAEGYRAMAAADPDRWVVVDGQGAVDEVADRVAAAVAARLPDPEPARRPDPGAAGLVGPGVDRRPALEAARRPDPGAAGPPGPGAARRPDLEAARRPDPGVAGPGDSIAARSDAPDAAGMPDPEAGR